MCTLGWRPCPDGYELWFNRDEKRSRPLSLDPTLLRGKKSGGLCAIDPTGQGTWLCTNQTGLTLAVLNAYPETTTTSRSSLKSRGQLPLLVLDASNENDLLGILETVVWTDYAPCYLVLISPSGNARSMLWNGLILEKKSTLTRTFLTTSSFQTKRICLKREAYYDANEHLPLETIFQQTDTQNPADGIVMQRSDAATMSQTHVIVGKDAIQFAVRRRGENFIHLRLTLK